MHLGLIGLGKMGANMRTRLLAAGIEVTGYDLDLEVSDVPDLPALVEALPAGQRVVWVMVPAGAPTKATVVALADLLTTGDLVIDGGNSHYADDAANAELLAARGIGYLDVGVSGGVWGLTNGYGLMVGGAEQDFAAVLPVLDALRPPGDRADSLVHVGPVGAGHYAKMIHNGIEYGLMQAYAEGYELLSAAELVRDVPGTLRAWTQGTVVRSWLLDLLVAALEADPELDAIDGWVPDSGEGRWTVHEAVELAVPAPVISAALFARFASRQEVSPAMKAVAALRHQFGGHAVRPANPDGPPKP